MEIRAFILLSVGSGLSQWWTEKYIVIEIQIKSFLASEDEDWTPRRYKRRIKLEQPPSEDEERLTAAASAAVKRGRKSLKTPDTHECFRTRGPGKGMRSFNLALDLFEGRHIDFIYVCHACYTYFDTEKKLIVHKANIHMKVGGGINDGDYHTGHANQFSCPKCLELVKVKHLVWFLKHLKYCGQDDERAGQIISLQAEIYYALKTESNILDAKLLDRELIIVRN